MTARQFYVGHERDLVRDRVATPVVHVDEYDSDCDSDVERDDHRTVKHHCTDIFCLFVFVAAIISLHGITIYAFSHGDIRRLAHGFDYRGKLCGVDEDVEERPFVYWCPISENNPFTPYDAVFDSNFTELDLMHPVCVKSCPVSSEGYHICFTGRKTVESRPNTVGTFSETVTYTYRKVKDYTSFTFAWRYCLPHPSHYKGIFDHLHEALLSSGYTRWILSASEIIQAKVPLMLSAVVSFCFSYLYILILYTGCGAEIALFGFIAITVLVCFGVGIFFLSVGYGGSSLIVLMTTSDRNWDLLFGYILVGLGILFIFIGLCAKRSLNVAVGCVQAAAKCVGDMPMLLLNPVFTLTLEAIMVLPCLICLLLVLTCGTVQHEYVTSHMSVGSGGIDVGGISRSFNRSYTEMWYIVFYIFMILWILEIINALGQFAICYGVEQWYFTPYENGKKRKVPWFPLGRGYIVGAWYHFGSLALGAFLVANVRVVRFVLSFLAREAKDIENQVGDSVAAVCVYCTQCFQRFVEYVNKNAYMDIAINSTSFCSAAYHSLQIMTGEVESVAFLSGACIIFQFVGAGGITTASVSFVLFMISYSESFTTITSPHYIQPGDQIVVLAATAIISFTIAVNFLVVFDTVADTMLYCWAVERRRARKGQIRDGVNYAPGQLHKLIYDRD